MEHYAKLGQKVLEQGVLDLFLGRRGHTLSGNPYPGGWLNRRKSTKNRMKVLRNDAEVFFFDDECRETLNFWFYLAGFHRPPRGRDLKRWLDEQIDARHPREAYVLD